MLEKKQIIKPNVSKCVKSSWNKEEMNMQFLVIFVGIWNISYLETVADCNSFGLDLMFRKNSIFSVP